MTPPIDPLAVYDWIKHRGLHIKNEGSLNSCLRGPYQELFGKNLFPSGCDKAAKVLLEVQAQHPLHDGNKRLGAALCLAVLDEYGLTPTINEDQLELFCLDIASGKLRDLEEISNFLSANTKPSPKTNNELITPVIKCGAWMPRARTECILKEGHGGHHRSIHPRRNPA
ncbi:hypothetical protein HMPREF9306_01248 [Propionimicrobium lymphophilum ACS-093-V-SCH5]|uniref:Fido domain-containing protein n=1 Tax=Propionimicrobium lymphophilum ACS-093-V-SCH5 TaxID=883161 RepID=S2W3L0_9ACTN|nr:hypothetical protein HMPREF9306_01248 [Propionimicrobium lymphophilum ACS-093-V-SCH5]